MLLTHCLNVLKGEVPNVYLTGLNEIVKMVPIGFPPLLCFLVALGGIGGNGKTRLCGVAGK